jgi:hypothetical protein
MDDERLNRQLLIEGWNQEALDNAQIGIIGDDDSLASMYLMSSAALGINDFVVIAPSLDERLINVAKSVNPELKIKFVKGNYTSQNLNCLLEDCDIITDVSHYGLANKLSLNLGYDKYKPVIRGLSDEEGFKVFTYERGREWSELESIISQPSFPNEHFDDPVLDMIASGILLEETKNKLMNEKISNELIVYNREPLADIDKSDNILVIGAGALGNFVGLGLGYSGFENITFMDPDVAEITNLNRQILLYDGVDKSKSATLAKRLKEFFGINAKSREQYFNSSSRIHNYDVIFDCVDNFETRIVLSEKCKAKNKILISGGTNVDAGQSVLYNPDVDDKTPAELLGLYDILGQRKLENYTRERASCVYRPDPSVIMTNQVIGGFMVDAYKRHLSGQTIENIFYDSKSDTRT